jgi:hypothetical protein
MSKYYVFDYVGNDLYPVRRDVGFVHGFIRRVCQRFRPVREWVWKR